VARILNRRNKPRKLEVSLEISFCLLPTRDLDYVSAILEYCSCTFWSWLELAMQDTQNIQQLQVDSIQTAVCRKTLQSEEIMGLFVPCGKFD